MERTKKVKKVFYQGGFDMFHWMHLESIRRAKAEGDYLIVGVNSDELIESYKDKKPVYPYRYREDIIKSLLYVDEVVRMDEFSCLNTLKKLDVDIYVTCEEWVEGESKEFDFMKQKGGKVVVLPYIKGEEFLHRIEEKMKENLEKKFLNLCDMCHRKI